MTTRSELELYIHIPFCVQKCNYCDFLSFSAQSEEMQEYVQALLRQIEYQKLEAKEYMVTTVFIGGGTPSLLSNKQMKDVFAKLHEVFHIMREAEITIEVNPGTVNEEKLHNYKALGINRLSIGLQSTHEVELKTLGRIHTYSEFMKTYAQAREAGFDNINIDLMSAIPGQSVASWQTNLKKVLKLEPEHISVYSLIIEEGTPFARWYQEEHLHSEYPPIPSEEVMLQMDDVTEKELKKQEYVRYEISNYAKKGYECRHNLGYWNRKEYLGLGLGAASYIENERFKNTSNMAKYIENPEALEEKQKLTRQEQMEEFCFLGLRKIEGIAEKDFQEQFQVSIEDVYAKELSELQEEGLLERKGSKISLTKRGLELGNYVFVKFVL